MTENDYGFNFEENAQALKNALEENEVRATVEDALTGEAAAKEQELHLAEEAAYEAHAAAEEAKLEAEYEARAAAEEEYKAQGSTLWPEKPVEPAWTQSTPEPAQTAENAEYFDKLNRPAPPVYDTESTGSKQEEKAKKAKVKKEKAPKKRGFFGRFVTAVVLGVLFGACAGLSCYGVFRYTGVLDKLEAADQIAHTQPVVTETIQDTVNVGVPEPMDYRVVSSDVSDVAEEVMPSMVSIVNNYVTTGSFFGHLFEENNAASGSGIIVGQNDTELLLVTNHHVVKDATSLEVTFIDGEVANANIKGMDADMDLAVIAVPLNSIPEETRGKIAIATLGDSDALKLGEPVVAIGNALGYGQSVTNGIVSALNREMTLSDGSTGTFIQTNAAINPGNSGGALLNIKGEVIGINSNKIGGSTVEGMGYAIPISAANPIIEDLQSKQTRTDKVDEAKRGYLGVSLQEITAEISQFYNMPVGAFIYSIEEGSAAEKAGLMRNDIIVKIEGEKVASAQDLRDVLQYFAVGDEVKLTVMRVESGEYVEHEIPVVLGTRPSVNQ